MALQDSTNPMQGVSGPGSFSKRTDLEYQSPEYGAGVAMQQLKSAAPLASTPDVRGATNTSVRQAAQGAVTPLYAPSQLPNQDIMHGTDIGPGAGSDALMLRQPDDSEFRNAIKDYMPVIAYISSLPNTSPETKRALRQIVDQL